MRISFKMATWEKHVQYLDAKPYPYFYIIMDGDKMIGNIYLSKLDEVGIFVKKEHKGSGAGSEALKLLLVNHKGKRILANINPENYRSIDFFTGKGFKHIQNTYQLFS